MATIYRRVFVDSRVRHVESETKEPETNEHLEVGFTVGDDAIIR